MGFVHDVTKLRMSTVVLQHTQYRLDEFVKVAMEWKMNEIIFNWPRRVGRLTEGSDIYPTISEKEFIRKYREMSDRYKNKIRITTHINELGKEDLGQCSGGQNLLFLDRNGKIAPCSWIYKQTPEFISKLSLFDSELSNCLYEIRDFRKIIEERVNRGFVGCPFIAIQDSDTFMVQDHRLM